MTVEELIAELHRPNLPKNARLAIMRQHIIWFAPDLSDGGFVCELPESQSVQTELENDSVRRILDPEVRNDG